MKKILSAAFLLFSFGVQAQQQEEVKLSYREISSVLPPMRVIDTTKQEYTEKDFNDKNHFFMFLFNPTCGHCIQMAKLVGDHIKEFKKNQVLFLAGPAMLPYMPSFYQASGIGKYPQVKVGIDSAGTVDRLYNYKTLPQINIYDAKRRLVKIFYGDTPLDSLRKYIP
jgi:thiol-disulfide isomerase/thioredoxin